ncbi:transposase [Candidatus Parabeggiatoa sp. HSG14]|uniref:transposase n=1 Tax=Candidatus Parabeggiatoa sp. HSG14 TaxID=3055593 RepID=UPI0025A83043|nr:transposase [Thiotrichales bacterium HSG14]
MIFIDETGCVRNITRPYARSTKGQRAHCSNSLTRGTRISSIGALFIPCYDGTMNAFFCLHFLLKYFVVNVLTSNNVVILDNAKSHYDEDAIALIEATGYGVIFLPT